MTIKEYLKRAQYVILGREKGVYTLLDTQNDEVITQKQIIYMLKTIKVGKLAVIFRPFLFIIIFNCNRKTIS